MKKSVHLHKETNNNEKMTIKFKSSKATNKIIVVDDDLPTKHINVPKFY